MDSFALEGSGTRPELRDRLVFLLRGGMTQRFHSAAVLRENTVAHHSWGVAWFCYLLRDGQPSAELLLAALSHDMAEQITSDVSAPAKRILGIRQLLQDKENSVLRSFEFAFQHELSPSEDRTLHLADCFDGMLFCIAERMFGNRFIEFTFAKFHSYISRSLKTDTERDLMNALTQMWEDAIGGPFSEQ